MTTTFARSLPCSRTLTLAHDRVLSFGDRPLVMGVINCTPDSFSDGGVCLAPEAALAAAEEMIHSGVDLIDIGGESTRPGARSVSPQEELARVLPAISAIRQRSKIPLSIDTTKASVAEAALAAGVDIVNDITALRGDAKMAEVIAAENAVVILMHMQGTPTTMQAKPQYAEVVGEVTAFLLARVEVARAAGIATERIMLDPGFGFGKTFSHNAALLRELPSLVAQGYPVLAGMSRKSLITHALGEQAGGLEASLALALMAVERGAAIVRVHDVPETVRAFRMRSAIMEGEI